MAYGRCQSERTLEQDREIFEAGGQAGRKAGRILKPEVDRKDRKLPEVEVIGEGVP